MLFIGGIDWFMPTKPTLNGGRFRIFRFVLDWIVAMSFGSTRS